MSSVHVLPSSGHLPGSSHTQTHTHRQTHTRRHTRTHRQTHADTHACARRRPEPASLRHRPLRPQDPHEDARPLQVEYYPPNGTFSLHYFPYYGRKAQVGRVSVLRQPPHTCRRLKGRGRPATLPLHRGPGGPCSPLGVSLPENTAPVRTPVPDLTVPGSQSFPNPFRQPYVHVKAQPSNLPIFLIFMVIFIQYNLHLTHPWCYPPSPDGDPRPSGGTARLHTGPARAEQAGAPSLPPDWLPSSRSS